LPVAKVRSRLTTLQQDRDRVRRHLDTVEQDLAEGADALTAALRLLDKPQQLFQTAGDTSRRLLTQTFFERLYVDEDDVTELRYQEPFGDLHDAARTWTTAMSAPQRRPLSRKAKSPDTNGAGLFHRGGPACSLPRPWTWVRVRRSWWDLGENLNPQVNGASVAVPNATCTHAKSRVCTRALRHGHGWTALRAGLLRCRLGAGGGRDRSARSSRSSTRSPRRCGS
jgi:hypothetical protein